MATYITVPQSLLVQAAEHVVGRAMRQGADGSAIARSGGGARIVVRNGRPERMERDIQQSLSITVYLDGRTGAATTSALDRDALERAVDEALMIAQQVQPDPIVGLVERSWMAWAPNPVELHEPISEGPADLLAIAQRIEMAATGKDREVTEAGAAVGESAWAMANSAGFSGHSTSSLHARWCALLGSSADGAAQDFVDSHDRRLAGLDDAERLAKLAVARTLARIGARGIRNYRGPVLFAPRTAIAVLQDLVAALNGHAQHRRASFLVDPLGKQILPGHVDLLEDPFEPYGLASGPFDGEGVAGALRLVIAAGTVEGLFLDGRSGRQLQMRSTGNAGGPYNLTLSSRSSPGGHDAMLRRLGTGLLVTHLLGGMTNPLSGGWSRAVAGFWVEDGEVAYPVQDITLGSDMPSMLRNTIAIGDDVERQTAFRSGSILIDDMLVGGSL